MPEERKDQVVFDVDKELTKQDWEGIQTLLQNLLGNARRDHMDVSLISQCMSILDPSIKLPITDQEIGEMRKGLEIDLSQHDGEWARSIIYTYSFFRMIGKPQEIVPEYLNYVLSHLDLQLDVDDDDVEIILNLHAISPSFVLPEYIERMRECLDEYMEGNEAYHVEYGAAIIATFRCLGEPIDIPKEFWKKCNELLQGSRNANNYYRFAQLASYMKIMAAHEVKMTDKGVELVMRGPHQKEDARMPSTLEI